MFVYTNKHTVHQTFVCVKNLINKSSLKIITHSCHEYICHVLCESLPFMLKNVVNNVIKIWCLNCA